MKYLIALSLAGLLAFSSVSQAAIALVKAGVLRTMVADADRWGGCMALLDQKLADYNVNCPGGWVTFSCTGTYTAKDNAYRMFDSAQMAFALEKEIVVQVDDTMKHNGYCFARRIDVFR